MVPADQVTTVSWLSSPEHAVLLCGSPMQWQRAAIAFLTEGLELGEPVIYLNGIYPATHVLGLLDLPDLRPWAQAGQERLLVRSVNQVLVPDGVFDSGAARENLASLIAEVGAKAAAPPRLLLDMNWGSYLRLGISQLLDCEDWLNEVFIPHFGCATLCHYERMLFTPMVIDVLAERHTRVLDAHPGDEPCFACGRALRGSGLWPRQQP